MDKSGAHKLAIDKLSQDSDEHIEVRQIKYLNNIVEQDHRAVKRITRPILGLRFLCAAASVLDGIELTHMIRKGLLFVTEGVSVLSRNNFMHAQFVQCHCASEN